MSERTASNLAIGIPKKSYEWNEKAACLDHVDGSAWQGEAFVTGKGVRRNMAHGMVLIASAAERGSIPAAFMLARRYYHGVNLPKDLKLAKYWLKKILDEREKSGFCYLAIVDEKMAEKMMADIESQE